MKLRACVWVCLISNYDNAGIVECRCINPMICAIQLPRLINETKPTPNSVHCVCGDARACVCLFSNGILNIRHKQSPIVVSCWLVRYCRSLRFTPLEVFNSNIIMHMIHTIPPESNKPSISLCLRNNHPTTSIPCYYVMCNCIGIFQYRNRVCWIKWVLSG